MWKWLSNELFYDGPYDDGPRKGAWNQILVWVRDAVQLSKKSDSANFDERKVKWKTW